MGDVDVVALLAAIERLVEAHCDELDALNVFPVPDADTGRNVLATVRAARRAAEQTAADPAAAAVDGALRGARGNSGVLLAQVLRGLLDPDEPRWDRRLATADRLTRAAVADPVEGSVLTAVRAAASAAADAVAAGDDGLAAAVAAAHDAVDATPSQLEVLARAGVVDAGARAFALVLESVHATLTGREPSPPAVHVPSEPPGGRDCTVSGGRYELMHLLDPSHPGAATALREGLAAVGDSVVVVNAGELVTVHVHTDDLGAALEVALRNGRPYELRVEDLFEQAEQAAARGRHGGDGVARGTAGLVVGADGDGLAELATTLGAVALALPTDRPPSVDELRAAVDRAGSAGRVVLLPGRRDVVGVAARLADELEELVVATAVDHPARVATALAVLDPAAPDVDALDAAAGAARVGHVRARGPGWTVELEGAGADSTTDDTDHDPLAALRRLATALPEAELVTLLVGTGVDDDDRRAAVATLQRRWPAAELDVVVDGTATLRYAVGVE